MLTYPDLDGLRDCDLERDRDREIERLLLRTLARD